MRPALFIGVLGLVARCSASQMPTPNDVARQNSAPSELKEIGQARSLLAAADWEARAWGAFLAGRFRNPALQAILVSELRGMRSSGHEPADSRGLAYVRSILDALITSGTSAPTEAVLPFLSVLPAESLILLTRSGAEEKDLLPLLTMDLDTPEWLVVGKLLLRIRSGQFLAEMLKGAEASHDFDISDPAIGHGHGGSNGIGPGCCLPEVIRQFPPRFPPIGLYELLTNSSSAARSPGTGDVLLFPAPQPVYYRRIVVPAGGSVRSPGRAKDVMPRRMHCVDFLAEAADLDSADVTRLFAAVTRVPWTNSDTVQHLVSQTLVEQEQRIRQLVTRAKQSGFHSVPPLQIRIEVRTVDHRSKSSDPIPTFNSRQITVN